MAQGVIQQPGGVASPTEVQGAGVDAWSQMTGVSPADPRVGGSGAFAGGGNLPYNVDGRISTMPAAGPTTPGVAAAHRDSWHGLLDLRRNPLSWLLIAVVVWLGLIRVRVSAAGGVGRG